MKYYLFKNSSAVLSALALFLSTAGMLPAQEGLKSKPDPNPQAK